MENSYKYFKRDISWLSFNYRVLLEAEDDTLPVYERIKFLSIYSSNLEEFYEIRVAEHRGVIMKKNYTEESGAEAEEVLTEITNEVNRQQREYYRIFSEKILPELHRQNIYLYQDSDPEPFHEEFVHNFFNEEVFPFLSPVMIQAGDIRTFIRDRRLYLVIRMVKKSNRKPEEGQAPEYHYAMMKIPYAKVPRFIELPEHEGKFYIMFIDDIIRANLDRSPLYSGMIEGTGPRYCPSIEDKVVRFADKKRHQVFIEPEGMYTNEMYIGGMSSSLPEDVQEEMYHSVPGLEHAKIVKNAYAIEYDCINPRQLYPTLEFKKIKGLFSGGQFNGSSGYEEAAAQGLIAGINAAMEVLGKEQLILDRSEAYIGVLIDDLVTKENHEPYRMMTSRAEYRLLLRQDNADLRLRKKGWEVGLVDDETYAKVVEKERLIAEEIQRVENTNVGMTEAVQSLLESKESTPLKSGISLAELIRRPELSYADVTPIDKNRPELAWDVQEQVNINIKYDGYIRRQMKQVEQFKKLEAKKIPEDLDYEKVKSLRIEARQKLELYRPVSIGQASRISGVSPADISVLLVYMEQYGKERH